MEMTGKPYEGYPRHFPFVWFHSRPSLRYQWRTRIGRKSILPPQPAARGGCFLMGCGGDMMGCFFYQPVRSSGLRKDNVFLT